MDIPLARTMEGRGGHGMRKTGYVKSAAILTGTGLVLRAAGMVLRVYVAGQLGAGGMGVYQLIFTVYNLSVTLATAGLSVTATRLCAQCLARGRPGAVRPVMRRMLALALALGLLCGLAQFALARPAAQWWLKDLRAVPALRLLAPSLPFMALSAVLRGYFLAVRRVRPNALAQLFEQAVRISMVVLLLARAVPHGLAAACAAAVVGNTVSEAASWCYMMACWGRARRTLGPPQKPHLPPWAIVQGLAPIAANQYLTSFLRTVENVMVPSCLAVAAASREVGLAQYGALRGMAMPVVFFPFSFLATLSTLLMPEITRAAERGERKTLQRLVQRTLLVTVVLSVPAGGLFCLFSGEIGMLLYQSGEIGLYLRVLGPLMPLMYLESMVDGILKGLGEQLATFRYAVLDSAFRLVAVAALVPRWGMPGFLFIMVCSNLLTSLLNLRRLLVVTGVRWNWCAWALQPGAAMAFAALCGALAARAGRAALSGTGWLFCGGAACGLVYFLALFALGNDGVREVRAALRARREKPGPGALNAGQTHKNVLQ